MGAVEPCCSGAGWSPGRVGAEVGKEVMPWARTSGAERENGGPRWGAWEVGVGGTRGGWGWTSGKLGGAGAVSWAQVCGVVEGDEKVCVCGVEEGDDDSWPESDLIRPA